MSDAPEQPPAESLAVPTNRDVVGSSMVNPELFYEHSGRPGLAIPMAILLAVPITVALAAIYAYVVVYCPVVGYVNVLFLGAFVFGGGWVLGRVAHVGKCRSPMMMGVIGLICGVIALYFSWVFFIKALIGGEVGLLDLMLNPLAFGQIILAVNAEGWWGPSGIAQWALVGIEAAVIVGGFTLAGLGAIGDGVFCEDCNRWCQPFEVMHLKPDPEKASEGQVSNSVLDLLKLDETDPSEFPRVEAHVLQCEGCSAMQAIRFYHVAQVMDDGELKEQREEIPGVLVQRG